MNWIHYTAPNTLYYDPVLYIIINIIISFMEPFIKEKELKVIHIKKKIMRERFKSPIIYIFLYTPIFHIYVKKEMLIN